MSRADVDIVQPDIPGATTFVKQARRQLASARVEGVDSESSYGLAYGAAVKAVTGALLATGRRVTAGEAGHVVLVREARSRLECDDAVFDRLDRMRRTRHQVFYDVREVSDVEVVGALEDAQALIDAAARAVLAASRAGRSGP